MSSLPSDRSFLRTAAIGGLITLAAAGLAWTGAAGGDAGALVLGALIVGIAIVMFSLMPPAARMLLAGWRRVGIGPRDPRNGARLADGLAIGVWLLWLAGAVVALPSAWVPMLAYLAAR